ncbi:Na+/H+ antiporter NhaC family protein [Virgibacillus halophilus]|uniref:Na+/H+ antiporter NhaC family protein n=1 Tax=Tigheibacillus halophilus TaxID=361280 RepID=A0ABU5C1L8_9BACI|nr:Na+/H+ antiporter NhaC family protein [Virgibacillus halophilus]
MVGTFYSIIPAIIMLLLVVLTRKVLLSLGAGIIIGALFIHQFHIGGTLKEIWAVFAEIFYHDGAWDTGNLLLLLFLLLLGVMTALLQATGGSRAFGEWASKRIKTRTGAQLMTVVLGVIIFIDDYFNALAVGQIARPLTDKHRISRAKLAYFIDSTSAPVTVLAPISSWGAYIIGILGGLFAVNNITDYKPLEAFLEMIPYNFYAIGALVLIFVVACFHFDFGPMRTHERRALHDGKLVSDTGKKIAGDLTEVFMPHKKRQGFPLVCPDHHIGACDNRIHVCNGVYGQRRMCRLLANICQYECERLTCNRGLGSSSVGIRFFMLHCHGQKPQLEKLFGKELKQCFLPFTSCYWHG